MFKAGAVNVLLRANLNDGVDGACPAGPGCPGAPFCPAGPGCPGAPFCPGGPGNPSFPGT